MDDSSQAKCLQSWAKCDSQVSYTILPLASMYVPCMLWLACMNIRDPLYLETHTHSLPCPINKSLHPEGKSQLGSLRRRWKDNIEIDLKEIGC
jgi:hypothetical protein